MYGATVTVSQILHSIITKSALKITEYRKGFLTHCRLSITHYSASTKIYCNVLKVNRQLLFILFSAIFQEHHATETNNITGCQFSKKSSSQRKLYKMLRCHSEKDAQFIILQTLQSVYTNNYLFLIWYH